MGNSKETLNHTAGPGMEEIERFSCIRGGLMARLARLGALLFFTANPDPASASLPPMADDMSYKERGPNNDLFYFEIEERYTESLSKILKMNRRASLLADFTESLDDPDKIAGMAPGFIDLAKKYGADAKKTQFILSKNDISAEDKKILIEQAKRVTQSWADIAKEHRRNLTALYAVTTNRASKDKIEAEIKETEELSRSLFAHGEYLSRQRNQIK